MTVLNIKHNKKVITRLLAGDASAVEDVVLRAAQNDCDRIHLPNAISDELVKAVTECAATKEIEVVRVNYQGISAQEIQDTIDYLARKNARESRIENTTRNRSKAHKNKLTPSQQQAKKRERAMKDRANCNGGKKKTEE